MSYRNFPYDQQIQDVLDASYRKHISKTSGVCKVLPRFCCLFTEYYGGRAFLRKRKVQNTLLPIFFLTNAFIQILSTVFVSKKIGWVLSFEPTYFFSLDQKRITQKRGGSFLRTQRQYYNCYNTGWLTKNLTKK
eukprot:TRINITY_DN1072_c0_g1_i1.p4 TRINITY_DN1072_c0_g1~~TRINITY_DN1072_c0_g1_i1.p4  ORF type:complete len:134 (+),score=1.21 TRINITY_DN1072_c0_g1_i1:123-524(+)